MSSRFSRSDDEYRTFTLEAEPKPEVVLTGVNGNALAIVAHVTQQMRRAGCSREHCKAFREEALSGNYDHVLITVFRWCEVIG